jgi:myo-inositol-hexaphosphate 3-phosphohydrolase
MPAFLAPIATLTAGLLLAGVANSADRLRVTQLEFLGEATVATGSQFEGTEIGGLSSITYDAEHDRYLVISDDPSSTNDARFYGVTIDLSDGRLANGDVTFESVTTLLNSEGVPFSAGSIDPEGLALSANGDLYMSSEGFTNSLVDPFIGQIDPEGGMITLLPLPDRYLTTADQSSGVRHNLAFESLTLTPDGDTLYTGAENALFQDGPASSVDNEGLTRVIQYDLSDNSIAHEFVYMSDPVLTPSDIFEVNGLVELLALDDAGTLLALERSFGVGSGYNLRLYEADTSNALDVSALNDLYREQPLEDDGEVIEPGPFEIDPPIAKRLLLELDGSELGITLDNVEGMTFGPDLPDGRRTLVLVSDNDFGLFDGTEFSQFLLFALETETIPSPAAALETPYTLDDEEAPEGVLRGDSDDPAIWIHPHDPSRSLVLVTLKDGGLMALDLDGRVAQRIVSEIFGAVRYNNVDVIYDFDLNGEGVDLAVASDRENDTLAIFRIDAASGELSDITSAHIPETLFGVDDGGETAYGLTAYTSAVTGDDYVFVSQNDADQIVQLQLFAEADGRVNAVEVRRLVVPVPEGEETDAAQVEGMVVDRESGYLYVGQEEFGIFKFEAEADASNEYTVVDTIENGQLQADVEGLTIYYAGRGRGYLLASSQGDSTFAVYERGCDNAYLGSFSVGANGDVDSVQESDGADVINVPLNADFPLGLFMVQDGANDPQNAVEDDEELENNSTNFKFIGWDAVAHGVAEVFGEPLIIDPYAAHPRRFAESTRLCQWLRWSGHQHHHQRPWTMDAVGKHLCNVGRFRRARDQQCIGRHDRLPALGFDGLGEGRVDRFGLKQDAMDRRHQ